MEKIDLDNYYYLKNKSGVYRIINRLNGKSYIGSSGNLYNRINSHYNSLVNNKHSNRYLQRAWNKYGEDNFEFYIISFVETCCLLEVEDIYSRLIGSHHSENGYDIFMWATTTKGNKWSQEARDRRKGYGLGRKVSEETKKRISKVNIGKKRTESSKQAYSKSKSVPIVMLDLDGNFIREWNSAKEASLWLGITPSTHISMVLKGKLGQCKGYIFVFKKDYNPNKIYKPVKQRGKRVLQYDLNDNFIKEWENAHQFLLENNKDLKCSRIYQCCKNKKNFKTAHGFKWRYKND